MKRITLVVLTCMLVGSCAKWEQDISHMKSNMGGLDRIVTLYDCSGNPIQSWRIKGTVEDQGGSFRFLNDGKAITISGTVVIEEVEK